MRKQSSVNKYTHDWLLSTHMLRQVFFNGKKNLFPGSTFTSSLSLSLNEAVSRDLVGLLSLGVWSTTDKLKPNYVFISRSFIGPDNKKFGQKLRKEDRERSRQDRRGKGRKIPKGL